jgi:hypothetical protein
MAVHAFHTYVHKSPEIKKGVDVLLLLQSRWGTVVRGGDDAAE